MSVGLLIVHDAVKHVQEAMLLWERDPELADRQARLIVSQLIYGGFIKGVVHSNGIPIDHDVEKQSV